MLSSSSSTKSLTENDSTSDSKISENTMKLKKYSWTADLVWRNRSFKDLYVFYDPVAGQLGFSKSKNDLPIYSSKQNEVVILITITFLPFLL